MPTLILVSKDRFWQKGLSPVPCSDSVYWEIFNAYPGLKINLLFPFIQLLEKEGKAAKQVREVTVQVAFTAEHTNSYLSTSPFYTSPFSLQQVTPKQMSHV